VTSGEQADQALVRRIEECLREPVYFRDILDATRDQKYRAVLLAGATSARGMRSSATSMGATGARSRHE